MKQNRHTSKNTYTILSIVVGIVVLILIIVVGGYWYVGRSGPLPLEGKNPVSFPSEKQDSVSIVWENHIRQDTVVGTLTAIDQSGGAMNGFAYRLKLSIAVGDKGDQSVYYFNPSEVSRITVFTVKDGVRESLSLTKLHSGDRIIVTQQIDLTKPQEHNLMEFTVRKL